MDAAKKDVISIRFLSGMAVIIASILNQKNPQKYCIKFRNVVQNVKFKTN